MKINTLYQVSSDPVIYTCAGSRNWHLLRGTPDKPIILLAHSMWFFGLSSIAFYRKLRKQLRQQHVRLIMLTNSPGEHRTARLAGFETGFINHNIHVNEHLFYPDPEAYQTKKYQAIYTAAAEPYKRLALASEIEKLYVVTYFYDKGKEKREWDLHKYEPAIEHCEYNRQRISPQEINILMNQSHTGLALSKKEGAMFASMEYLMAGLPVVNTYNRGGRDIYFEPEYVWTVPGNADSVKRAVDEAIKASPDPEMIRRRTMDKVHRDRKSFYDLLARVCEELGKQPEHDFEAFCDEVWGGTGLAKTAIDPASLAERLA